MKEKKTSTKNSLTNSSIFTVLFYCTGIFLLFSIFYNFIPSQIAFTSDAGLTFAVADYSLSGHLPLLGAPSHTGGRHLGPLYYFLTAIFYFLSGRDILISHILYACFLVSGIALWLQFFWQISFPFSNYRNRFFYLCSSVFFCALITKPCIELFRYYWQPHFFLFFTPLFLLSLIEVSQKRSGAVLKALITSSFMIQIHYGSLPLVACFWFCFLFYRLSGRREKNSHDRFLNTNALIVICILLCLWVPSLYYEIFIEHNFIRTLIPHLVEVTKPSPAEFSLRGFILTYLQEQNRWLECIQQLPQLLKVSGYVLILFISLQSLFFLKGNKIFISFFIASILSLLAFAGLLSFTLESKRIYYLYPLLGITPALFAVLIGSFLINFSKGEKSFEIIVCSLISCLGLYSTFDVVSSRAIISTHSLKNIMTMSVFIPKKDRESPLQLTTPDFESPITGSLQFFIGSTQYPFINDWSRLREFQTSTTLMNPTLYKSAWQYSCNQRIPVTASEKNERKEEDTFQSGRCIMRRLNSIQ